MTNVLRQDRRRKTGDPTSREAARFLCFRGFTRRTLLQYSLHFVDDVRFHHVADFEVVEIFDR